MSPKNPKSARSETPVETASQSEEDAALWALKVGTKRGDIVTAYERPEKKGVIYLRWTDPSTGKYVKRATGLTIRDANGRRIQARITRVAKLAGDQQDALRDARRDLWKEETETALLGDAGAANATPGVPMASTGAIQESDATPPRRGRIDMTLGEGIARALRVGDGLFASANDHARDTANSLRRALGVLDPNLLWGDTTAGTYRQLWRGLADGFARDAELLEAQRRDARRAGNIELAESLERRRPRGGFRATEMAVISLLHVAKWLADEQRVDVGAAWATNKWRKELAADWKRLVPVQYQQPNRVAAASVTFRRENEAAFSTGDREDPTRYTEAEAGRLLIALTRADPRLRHAVELAGEGRLGQLTRTRRSNLRLGEGAGMLGLGFYAVEGRGTKIGIDVDLDAGQRAVTDEMLTSGYLAELEKGFRDGTFSDYWLFPGGRLVLGRSRTDAQVPMDDRTLNDLWLQLERLASVTHFAARAHYGYRRLATDVA